MLCRPLRLPTMYDGDQKLKPRSSEKNSNEFLAEETKGRDPPRHNAVPKMFPLPISSLLASLCTLYT